MAYDVIVVGAGPAGSAAATALVQKGHDVLLLDRQLFPRDKACGDAIPSTAVKVLYELGMENKIRQAGFYPIRSLRLVSPRAHKLDVNFGPNNANVDTYIAPRLAFDALLQQHAVETGARFQIAQVREPILEHGRVVGVRAQVNGHAKDFLAKVVIGADGATSVVGRSLRSSEQQANHRAVALRAYIDDLEILPHTVEFYLYQDILPGYAWIFPLGENRANIGLGIRLDKFRNGKLNLKRMLSDFLALPPIKKRLGQAGQWQDVATWPLNYGSQRRIQRAFDGAVLIGDAGAFINPLTGGGIHNALLSAQIAAEVIDEGLNVGDVSRRTLRKFEKRCHKLFWGDMYWSYLVQRSISYPFLVDLIIKRATVDSKISKIFVQKL